MTPPPVQEKVHSRSSRKRIEHNGITVQIVEMTPRRAADLLLRNSQNRKLKLHTLERYKADLESGNWMFDGSPVRVDVNGKLLDGQHRLKAVVDTGISAPFLLVEGVDTSAQIVMDTGIKRTFADHLRIQGVPYASNLATVVRAYYKYEQHRTGGVSIFSHAVPSLITLNNVYELHKGLLNQVAKESHNFYTGGLHLPTGAIAVALIAFREIDREDTQYFFERAVTGTGLLDEGRTQPILMLRRYATALSSGEYRRHWYVSLAALIKAWNSFRDGKTISNVAPRFGGSRPEEWPWPK